MADLTQHLVNLEKRVRRLEQIVEQQVSKPRATAPEPSMQPAAAAEAAAPAPVRIGTLVVLGVTLYIGGWLYQKLSADEGDGERGTLAQAGNG